MAVLITVIGFGIMIMLHELGHFTVAKCFGVQVHEFAIGMGPRLVSFGKGETRYSIRLFPIGGFVQLEGENDTEESDNPRSFMNLPPIKRIAILIAGAVMNIILGWIMFMIINSQTGVIPTVIESIAQDYATVQTQLKPGDEILKLNKTRVHTFDDVSLFMGHADGSDIKVTLKRSGERKTVKLTPINTGYGYKLGVTFRRENVTALTAPRYAFYDTVYISKAVISALGELITGKSGLDTLSGPVEIVSVVGEVTKEKDNPYTALNVLMLFAMITVNLGVFNLLPFPALDGGSIVFALWELITRKKVRPDIQAYISVAGFALLMLLAVFVTIGDIRKLFM